jgi:hypothetical protein
MKTIERCGREDELLDALGRGLVGGELEAHVEQCAACSDLRLVAGALLGDRTDAMREAAVPSSASMWWRMQMRYRQDVAKATTRSLLIGQALTLALAIGLTALIFGGEVTGAVRHLATSINVSTPILLAIATTIVAAPFAGYVASRSK